MNVESWSLLATPAQAVSHPADLPRVGWSVPGVGGTVAGILDLPVEYASDLDAEDWWFRASISVGQPGRHRITFGGLATLAEVWLNGAPLLRSRNMFVEHVVDVVLASEAELVIVCRALTPELARKRPRPRWKTALVSSQNLRFFRTSLYGRIPAWTPRLPVVGPWRGVRVEPLGQVEVDTIELHSSLDAGVPRLRLSAQVRGAHVLGALVVGDRTVEVAIENGRLHADLRLEGLALWWPHTHGEPALYEVLLRLGPNTLRLGRVGFRSVVLEADGGAVRFILNDVPVFCRGACAAMPDPRHGDADAAHVRRTLTQLRDAGANLLRIGGTTVYASAVLLDVADELGLMVWQDFMFANLDYPLDDPELSAVVEPEVLGVLSRFRSHPSVVAYCGGSEIEQQAAMVGLPRSEWSQAFFDERLPSTIARLHPGVVYFPSTPTGGPLPFSTSVGLTHYYGVGAYRRPVSDVRAAAVKFTAECLGFSNVPDEAGCARAVPGGARVVPHLPAWKAGVPRDNTAGWDFEDVRDHYLGVLFGVNPLDVRYADPEHYLALSRVVPGELMARAFAEWRRAGSGTGGALIWFLQDLRPGAGWGVLDESGAAKPVYWYLKRAWASRAVLLTDEGLDGAGVHIVNDAPAPLRGEVELELWRGARPVGRARQAVELAGHSTQSLAADALFGQFLDLGWAYRFGPPRHDVLVATLVVDGVCVSQDVLFPLGHGLPAQNEPGLQASAVALPSGEVALRLRAAAFIQALSVVSPGWEPDDNWFHLSPGREKVVTFRAFDPSRPFKASLSALNAEHLPTVRLPA